MARFRRSTLASVNDLQVTGNDCAAPPQPSFRPAASIRRHASFSKSSDVANDNRKYGDRPYPAPSGTATPDSSK